MDDAVLVSYKIEDRSYVSFVKREIHNLVAAAEFRAQTIGEIDIIVSELTSNVVKFAEEGELLYRVSRDENGLFFEVYCIDNGKGITNLAKMMQDGNSSVNTLGQGLGAIERLSSVSTVYTVPDWGTIVYSKVYKDDIANLPLKKVVYPGVVQVCCPGEKVCGDGYSIKKVSDGFQFLMADGLGHGPNAHEAAQEAIKAFQACNAKSPAEILRHINDNIKKTRGAVATVAYVNFTGKKWLICGIGNISTSIYTGLSGKNYTPYNGILGHNIPRTLNDSLVELDKYQTLIMHSDGLRTRWNLAELPGILKHDPNMLSAALYKDNARHNDDMSVLAAKINM